MTNSLSRVRANFMLALCASLGNTRPPVISRKDLLDAIAKMQMGTLGPLGLELRAPSWLTNGDEYRTARGEYSLPWDGLDSYQSEQAQKAQEKANAAAAKASAKAAVAAQKAQAAQAAAAQMQNP